nr:hypothetical protein [Tanacetum cinerariifolium]
MYIDKPIVGIERQMEAVLSSIERGIDEVRMIGISGIGGGGKTTLAISWQKQVILDVSNGKDMVIHSVGHGKNMIMNILQGKKVLIVLDDVDHNDQLVALIDEPSWYKDIFLDVAYREMRSLIRFSSDQHLDMHDHIQGMGKYIVQRKYPDDPKKHSRLWEREKIEEILDNEWVSEETKAIALDECLTSDIVAKENFNQIILLHLKFMDVKLKDFRKGRKR